MTPRRYGLRRNVGLGVGLGLFACASPTPPPAEGPQIVREEVYTRAASGRADQLERELERLRDDLRRAEEALVLVESGMRGSHGRADAVSSLAEARIEVERAADDAPWRARDMAEARTKLDEADLQIREGHFGSALFFVYRASRMAALVSEEARQARELPGTRFVRGDRVNLRVGPSTDEEVLIVLSQGTPVFPEDSNDEWILVRISAGNVGWIHDSLLR